MNVVREERPIEVGAAGRRYNEIRNNVSSHVNYQEFTLEGFPYLFFLMLFVMCCMFSSPI